MLSVLEITHKYGMHELEKCVIERVERAEKTQEFIEMILAARITGNSKLYEKAIEGLRSVSPKPDWEQAQAIGLKAYFSIMSR
jgi:hypothetical protein